MGRRIPPGTGPDEASTLVEALVAAVRAAGRLQTPEIAKIPARRGMRPRQLEDVAAP